MAAEGEYRAWRADRQAGLRRCRPKAEKLAVVAGLAAAVEVGLQQGWSPEQISGRLPMEFPDDQRDAGVARDDLPVVVSCRAGVSCARSWRPCLRTGRARRRNRSAGSRRRGRIPDMVMISERPAEVEDRAVPGHWEGDLIIGRTRRQRRDRHAGRAVHPLRAAAAPGPGPHRRPRSARPCCRDDQDPARPAATLHHLGPRHTRWPDTPAFSIDTGIQIYFCDPHTPWQRGTNENTNGLLRQYFPKGTDLVTSHRSRPRRRRRQLNNRPRKTLGFETPLDRSTGPLSDEQHTAPPGWRADLQP